MTLRLSRYCFDGGSVRRKPIKRSIYGVVVVCLLLSANAFSFEWSDAYFRGTPNSWSTTAMTQNHETDLWEIEVTFSSSNPRFKIARWENWNESYPGSDYQITQGSGTYRISFNDETKQINAIKHIEPGGVISGSSICFDNANGYSNPHMHFWDANPSVNMNSNWPGVSMTPQGSFYCYDFGVNLNSLNVVFSDNGGAQTNDLSISSGNNCFWGGSWTTLTDCGFTIDDDTPVGGRPIVYYDNSNGWSFPHVYLFNPEPDVFIVNSWPGSEMTYTNVGSIFQFDLGNDFKRVDVVFSDNGTPQTADLTWTPAKPCFQSGAWVTAEACGISLPLACDDDFDSFVPADRGYRLLTSEEYENTLQDLLHLPHLAIAEVLPEDNRVNGFTTDGNATVSLLHVSGYIEAALLAAEQVENIYDVAPSCADINCVVTQFGKRAFRRPLTDAEHARFVNLYNTNNEDATALLAAILASPTVVQRSELGLLQTAGDIDGLYKLDSYEVATLLSYSLLASTPDDTSLALADAGELQTPEQIRNEAERLLSTERAQNAFNRFIEGYLSNYTAISSNQISQNLKEAMVEETRRMVSDVVFDQQGTFEDLFMANYTWVNFELAQHYGMLGVPDDEQWHRVVYDGENAERSGILGHASFLTRTSDNLKPNPTMRGLFVRNQLLCQPISVSNYLLRILPNDDLTLREQVEYRHANGFGVCEECADYLDGIGFGFGAYNQLGLFEPEEQLGNGSVVTVDTYASINNLNTLDTDLLAGTASEAFTGAAELSQLLADSANGKACIVRQYHRYLSGENESEDDNCALKDVSQTMIDEGSAMTILEMMLEFTQAKHFILRKVAGE